MDKAKTLREWRNVWAMNQDEFAAFLGVNLPSYRAWEQGAHVPRYPQQRAIAEKLGVAVTQVAYPHKGHSARLG